MLVVECIHSSYIYIISDKKNGNKQIRIAVVVVPDLFWCWWWLFAWFYSPLFITKLRNTLRIILCHSTRVWIHQEESTNLFQKGAFYGGRELYKCFFFALGNCLCGTSFFVISELHNWECANSHAFPPLSIYFGKRILIF